MKDIIDKISVVLIGKENLIIFVWILDLNLFMYVSGIWEDKRKKKK